MRLASKQSLIPLLFASAWQASSSSRSFLLNDKSAMEQLDSQIFIFGGSMSCSQHIIAGIHSQIITPSGGQHLNVPSLYSKSETDMPAIVPLKDIFAAIIFAYGCGRF